MNAIKTIVHTALLMISVSLSTSAQIIVAVRPARPNYQKVVAPKAGYVWVEEDWAVRGNKYVFVGGRWVAPPRRNAFWVPGHWRQRRRGWVWVPGHWR